MKSMALLTGAVFFAALPATSTYKLNSYSFGSGGAANTQTTTYSLEGETGDFSSTSSSTSSSSTKSGFVQAQQANVPYLASLDNGSGVYYNNLHFVLDNTQGNPADATYLIAVSTSATLNSTTGEFASNQYLQPDGTLSSTLSLSDYQTYSAWGSTGGSFMIGLQSNTAYYVHVKATQGNKTESGYGPVTNATTASPTLSFNLVTSNQPTPPFSIAIGSLVAGTVTTAPQTINTTFSTNSSNGGSVYVNSLNGGLKSTIANNTINSSNADLSATSNGYGAQGGTVGQTSGGPYSVVSPFNVSGSSVGKFGANTIKSLYTSSAPITAGTGALIIKARAASSDVAASDYTDILTFTAAGNF